MSEPTRTVTLTDKEWAVVMASVLFVNDPEAQVLAPKLMALILKVQS